MNPYLLAVIVVVAGIFIFMAQRPASDTLRRTNELAPNSALSSSKKVDVSQNLLGSILNQTPGSGSAIPLYKTDITWQGIYYPGATFPADATSQKALITNAKKFSTLTECIRWGRTELLKNPRDAFECAYNCRFDDKAKSIICKDTTKAITQNRFSAPPLLQKSQ